MTVIDLTDTPRASRLGARAAVLGIWTGAAVLMAGTLHIQSGLPFRFGLTGSLIYCYVLAVLMIPVADLCRSFANAAISPATRGLAHLGVGLAVVSLWQGVYGLSLRLLIGPAFWREAFARDWPFQLMFAFLIYGLAVGVVLYRQARQRERLREEREAELRLTAREAELTAIRAQLQPHFLLNALNSILALIESQPERARAMVVRLADLLRTVFAASETSAVALRQELELIRAYLEIEGVRFASRLRVTEAVDSDALDVLVPTLLLQPLVENAVKHGIAPCPEGGEIRITAAVQDRRLRLSVRNSSSGRPGSGETETGRGLELTRRRLEAAYGADQALSIERSESSFTVCLDLPARSHGG